MILHDIKCLRNSCSSGGPVFMNKSRHDSNQGVLTFRLKKKQLKFKKIQGPKVKRLKEIIQLLVSKLRNIELGFLFENFIKHQSGQR